MTNSLLDIIGRTDTEHPGPVQKIEHKKRAPKGPLTYFGILTELFQTCFQPSGNLLSNSACIASSNSRAISRFSPIYFSFTYQLSLFLTRLSNKSNSLSPNLLYIFIIFISFGCSALRGGLVLKYDEVAREASCEILENESNVVKYESQEINKNTLNTKGALDATQKTKPTPVKTPIQK